MIFQFLIIYIKAGSFYKLIEIGIISAVKFLVAPLVSFSFGYNYLQTIIITTIGGIAGVFFFFYLSAFLLKIFRRYWSKIKNFFSKPKLHSKTITVEKPKRIIKTKKYFSRKNKFIVMTKRKYGLWGIAALTPILLSIPLGTFLANKYYRNKKSVLVSLTISVLSWSIIISSFYLFFKPSH